MPSVSARIKSAELLSGIGAVVLGLGLGLLAPMPMQRFALPLLGTGVLLHGAGMTLKHRLEIGEREPQWWELAVFWACWAGMLATLGSVAYLLVAPSSG
jgi:hypothetical protein